MREWLDWYDIERARFLGGVERDAPPTLPHPATVPEMTPLAFAEPRGQVADWGFGLPDGSRLHVQGWPDGRLIVHRDKWNPARGWVSAGVHIATETVAGGILLSVLTGILGAAAARFVSDYWRR